jgi:hypothetical protein
VSLDPATARCSSFSALASEYVYRARERVEGKTTGVNEKPFGKPPAE